MNDDDQKHMDVTRFRRHKSTSSLKLLERKGAHLVKMSYPRTEIENFWNRCQAAKLVAC